ncbi:hypothetical protein BDAP_002689 [Binucleata daphniae]
MYNTTENLILAIAYNLYGCNASKIQLYIKSRSIKTDVSSWYVNLKKLQSNAKQHGYTNLIEFCEDVRYSALIKVYKQKTEIRQQILENKIDPNTYLATIPEEYQSKEEKVIFDCQDSTNQFEDETDTSIIDPKLKLKEIQENIRKIDESEKVQVEVKNDIENKIIKDKEELPKYEKKYYLKMNQSERELDDFLDVVDDKFASINNQDSAINDRTSNIGEVFPALGKVKNIEERKQLIGKEIKEENKVIIDHKKSSNEEVSVKRYKKTVTLEDQYKNIMEKIYGRKKEEKEKLQWVEELKTILKVMQVKVEGPTQKDTSRIKLSLKDIMNEITFESSMSHVILKILMIIQDVYFELEEKVKMKTVLEFKKLLCFFFDFYRK